MLFGLQPSVRSTEAEAKLREEELRQRIPLEATLARMCGVFGIDLSTIDPDQPQADMETQASRGLLAASTSGADGQQLTLRDAAKPCRAASSPAKAAWTGCSGPANPVLETFLDTHVRYRTNQFSVSDYTARYEKHLRPHIHRPPQYGQVPICERI